MNTLYIVIPEALIEDANHMEYCFESCFPSMPLFSVNMKDENGNRFAVSSPFVSDNFVNNFMQHMADGFLPEPAWNIEQFDEAGNSLGYLVDMTKANNALVNSVMHEEEMALTNKIVISINSAPDFGLSNIPQE